MGGQTGLEGSWQALGKLRKPSLCGQVGMPSDSTANLPLGKLSVMWQGRPYGGDPPAPQSHRLLRVQREQNLRSASYSHHCLLSYPHSNLSALRVYTTGIPLQMSSHWGRAGRGLESACQCFYVVSFKIF